MISMNQQEQTLERLDTPRPCSIVFANDDAIVFCGKEAHWSVDGGPVCMQDIRNMAGMNSDNEEFFKPALQESNISEPKMYPDWESAQEAMDRGETVRIEMPPFKIDPALVQLALDLQFKERLEQWRKMQEAENNGQ